MPLLLPTTTRANWYWLPVHQQPRTGREATCNLRGPDQHRQPCHCRSVKRSCPRRTFRATGVELGITELITRERRPPGSWLVRRAQAQRCRGGQFLRYRRGPGEVLLQSLPGPDQRVGRLRGWFNHYRRRTLKEALAASPGQQRNALSDRFLGRIPIDRALEHGMVGYYNDGEGRAWTRPFIRPGRLPRFINNTPYHLLIENYYNEGVRPLTFKFYSTSMGRRGEGTSQSSRTSWPRRRKISGSTTRKFRRHGRTV